MTPQITIEQLRRAVVKGRESFLEKNVYDVIMCAAMSNILDIIDNPEKYKHLWEDRE